MSRRRARTTAGRHRTGNAQSIALPGDARLFCASIALALSVALLLMLLLPITARASAPPSLGAVPKVAHDTTGPKPPKNVHFRVKSIGGATGPLATYGAGLGETLVPGVPAYAWRDGCGPTAVGMVVGYYDGLGWTDLVPGAALLVTPEVNQMIASHGTADAPQHYEDYSLPMESGSSGVLADKSAPPAGDEHASDSAADFMHTSWSADGLQYGWSYSNMVGPAFTNYVKLHYPSSSPSSSTYYMGSTLTWTLVKQQIDAGTPMVFLVDSSGDGYTDHFVTIIGYREINGYPEYACWDTWNTTIVRWQQFRAMSSSWAWGVWGGFTLSLPGPPPDTTPPVTTCKKTKRSGYYLRATDDRSGVAHTYYSFDQSAWTEGVSFRFPATEHTVFFYSVDGAGNVETTHSVPASGT